MSKTFICRQCKKRYHKNPRLKGIQKYCGSAACQQFRKTEWERNKLVEDPVYQSKRQADKKRWYLKYPGYKYQSAYRKFHPSYGEDNRKKQLLRNEKRQISAASTKIVKTDTLIVESFIGGGFYALFPCKNASGEKIVKTDALIVQLTGIQDNAAIFMNKSP